MKLIPSLAACLFLAVAAFGVSAAAAQDANPNANPNADQDQDARAHFRRAIEQFNEENYDAALAEFQRAYAIDPANAILYNIARVYAGQGNAVEAARNYERYLRDGGPDLLPERRAEVEAALATQRGRIGHVEVVVSVDGATIAIDGADVARSPLYEPLAVSAGTVDIEVRAPNHTDVRRRVTVAGGSVERVEIELQEAVQPGILRIESEVPGVVIEIDGRHVGETPLNASVSLPVGDHRVVARRPGYRPFEQDFHTSQNSRAEIVLEMQPDPFAPAENLGALMLRLPDAGYEAMVDGRAVNHDGLRTLPAGRHRLELTVEDRLPFRGVVDIEGGGETEFTPPLEWTAAARQERVDSAASRKSIGIGMTIGGVVVGLAGVSVAAWNESEVNATDAALVEANEDIVETCAGATGTDACMDAEAVGMALQEDVDRQQVIRGVSWALGITGIVSLAVGLVLWLEAPDEDDIDEAARARVNVVPLEGGMMLASTIPL